MPAGRPTSYKPEMCEKVIALMKDGHSKTVVAAELDICKDTFYRWCDPDGDSYIQEFSDSVKKGVSLSEAWWEKEGHLALRDDKFNSTLWYMNMKNRFNWADKKEIKSDTTIKGYVSDDPMLEEDWENEHGAT